MDPEIDAIILRLAPQLADDAMPIILRHDPHGFGGFTDAGGMVVMTVEKAAGTHLITFMDVVLESAKRGRALSQLVPRVRETNPDVVVRVGGLLRPTVAVTRALADAEATGKAVNAAVRRIEEVSALVAEGRAALCGRTVGFDYGQGD